jgi:hypothetical protein
MRISPGERTIVACPLIVYREKVRVRHGSRRNQVLLLVAAPQRLFWCGPARIIMIEVRGGRDDRRGALT